ncbi:MAG: DUF5069 domain-containing protein [Candidatus Synoicihabitans palmerolidicus]|nr:DUF5069 domain-containing protein [Candidatus Synoicihabitans palmerolidicus]
MLDKIRLHASSQLPADYQANLGDAKTDVLDGRCCRFLGVRCDDMRDQVLAVADNETTLVWAHKHGTPRTDEGVSYLESFPP